MLPDNRCLTYDEFDEICASFPATHKVVQWGGAHVWKVGEKVFAIGGWSDGSHPFVTFKCLPQSFDILKEMTGLKAGTLSGTARRKMDPDAWRTGLVP